LEFLFEYDKKADKKMTTKEFKKSILEWQEINGIETRPIVTGNIARHPVAELYPDIFNVSLPGADIIHNSGFYIGLSPMQNKNSIDKVIEIFKKIRKGL